VSIPAQVHRLLREQAEQQDRFKGDLVVEALRAHGESLVCDHHRFARRRVRVEDPTQCQLYLTDLERQAIDDLAHRLGLSRSRLITMLLERTLATDPVN
jgi:hypothetical protein